MAKREGPSLDIIHDLATGRRRHFFQRLKAFAATAGLVGQMWAKFSNQLRKTVHKHLILLVGDEGLEPSTR